MAQRREVEPRVTRESVEDTVRRLEIYVRRLEARYECPSAEMESEVLAGRRKETAEIGRWLASHRTLSRLKANAGPETGTPTTTIK